SGWGVVWCGVAVRFFVFSSGGRHGSFSRDWSSDVCSSDLGLRHATATRIGAHRCGAPIASDDTRDRGWPVQALVATLLRRSRFEIGRASCRERVWISDVRATYKKTHTVPPARASDQ